MRDKFSKRVAIHVLTKIKTMKANFILRKDNTKRFIDAFNKMISISGSVVTQSHYVGKKDIASMLKKKGIKKTSFLIPVLNTIPVYSVHGNARLIKDSYGISFAMNSSHGDYLYWGTKMRITPNRIYIIEPSKFSLPRHITTIKPHGNISSAKEAIEMDELESRQYYEDVMDIFY